MSTRIGRKQNQQAQLSDPDSRGGLMIALSQAGNSLAIWHFRVFAETKEGSFTVGEFANSSPAQGSLPARVVAMASCPGAVQWLVDIDFIEGADRDAGLDQGEVTLSVGWGTTELGLHRVGERYAYLAGVAGVVPIRPGQVVQSWSAFSSGLVATAQIGSGPLIVIPTPGSIAGSPNGILKGATTFTFVNTAGYLIELALSA